MTPAPSRVAGWLALAAAPTFALMALAKALQEARGVMICSPGAGGSPISSMVVMYLLMSGFHTAPWLRLRR